MAEEKTERKAEPKKHSRLVDILKSESTFVLDSTAFDRLLGENCLLKKLGKELFWLKGMPIKSAMAKKNVGLTADIEEEEEYLHMLAFLMRESENYFTTQNVVDELHKYYKKIGELEHQFLCMGNVNVAVSSFLGGIANAICASQNYGVPRTQKVIEENGSKIGKYIDWMTKNKHNHHPKGYAMSNTDREILALSLTLAGQETTTLFTGDVNHVGNTAKQMYGFSVREEHFPQFLASELPAERLLVYAGFEPGWKLWMDSEKRPQPPKT